MPTIDLTSQLLSWLLTYGSPLVAVVLMGTAMGAPVPSTLLVIAVGALVRQGTLDLFPIFLYALAGVLAGDLLSYAIGRFAGGRLLGRNGSSERWIEVQQKLDRSGGLAIYLTRWLLTPLAVPTNLLAGTVGYPLRKFVAFDLAGEVTWLLMLGGLGYAFSASSAIIAELVGAYGAPVAGTAVGGLAIYWWFRRRTGPEPLALALQPRPTDAL